MILNRGGEAFIIIFILFGKIFNLDYLIEQRTDNLSLQERSPPPKKKMNIHKEYGLGCTWSMFGWLLNFILKWDKIQENVKNLVEANKLYLDSNTPPPIFNLNRNIMIVSLIKMAYKRF